MKDRNIAVVFSRFCESLCVCSPLSFSGGRPYRGGLGLKGGSLSCRSCRLYFYSFVGFVASSLSGLAFLLPTAFAGKEFYFGLVQCGILLSAPDVSRASLTSGCFFSSLDNLLSASTASGRVFDV